MNRKIIITLGTILALLLITAVGAYAFVNASPIEEASLQITFGTVEVDQGDGYQPAEHNMQLEEGDKIRTGENTEAMIVLQESIMVTLESNTEITLTEISDDTVRVTQERGTLWHTFLNVFGIETYEVKTSNAVATVRGTSFGTSDAVLVGEGEVEVMSEEELFTITTGKKFANGSMQELTPEEKRKALAMMNKQLTMMKEVRNREAEEEMDRLPVVRIMLEKRGITDQQVRDAAERVDNGEYDVDKLMDQAPLRSKGPRKKKQGKSKKKNA